MRLSDKKIIAASASCEKLVDCRAIEMDEHCKVQERGRLTLRCQWRTCLRFVLWLMYGDCKGDTRMLD